MEFLRSTLALMQLEVQHTVRSMSHSLQRGCQHHAWLFQLIDRLPVGSGGAGFHKKEGLLLDAAHKVMLHACINGSKIFLFFVPSRVVVPGHNIQNVTEFLIIQSIVIVHQIGCYLKL